MVVRKMETPIWFRRGPGNILRLLFIQIMKSTCVWINLHNLSLSWQVVPVASQWTKWVREVCPNSFQYVILFIDGTVRRTCRPRTHRSKLPLEKKCGINNVNTPSTGSGHRNYHDIKYQVMISPIRRVVVSLYGPVDGRRHDAFILEEESGLLPLPAWGANYRWNQLSCLSTATVRTR